MNNILKIKWIYHASAPEFDTYGKISANSAPEAIYIIRKLHPQTEKIEAVEAVWIKGEPLKLYYYENLMT